MTKFGHYFCVGEGFPFSGDLEKSKEDRIVFHKKCSPFGHRVGWAWPKKKQGFPIQTNNCFLLLCFIIPDGRDVLLQRERYAEPEDEYPALIQEWKNAMTEQNGVPQVSMLHERVARQYQYLVKDGLKRRHFPLFSWNNFLFFLCPLDQKWSTAENTIYKIITIICLYYFPW